ncbi:MAG TPA: Crp/Fnr family transcriptional regulator [Anaerolineales bacterium]
MRIQNDIDRLIQFYPVLGELPPRLQHNLLDSSYPVQAATGEVLFDIDATIQSFILLTQGAIRVISPGRERELVLYRVQPGGCCAISICHLLGDTRYRARAVVESAIKGVALPQPLFREMVEQSPYFSYFILHTFSERFTQLIELIERVTSMRLDERLARLLVTRGPLIRTTHSQLADELGSVREVISRILKDFEARGLIKLERGQIQILDPESLQQFPQNM